MRRSRCLVFIFAALMGVATAADADSLQSFLMPPTGFSILSADTGQVVGHGQYSAVRNGDGIDLRGDSRYLDGAYDIEEDRLAISDGKPVLKHFRHSFFYRGGAPQSEAQADVSSGLAACIYYQGATQTREDKKIDFPPDSYAGVTVLLPIQEFLRNRRDGATLNLHVFNCAPSPRLFLVEVKPEAAPIRWVHYPQSPLEQVDVKPNFGFWNFVVLPFVPKLGAWFDPADDWEIIGARLQRYYRGPNIIMVREGSAAPAHGRAADAKNPSVAGAPPP